MHAHTHCCAHTHYTRTCTNLTLSTLRGFSYTCRITCTGSMFVDIVRTKSVCLNRHSSCVLSLSTRPTVNVWGPRVAQCVKMEPRGISSWYKFRLHHVRLRSFSLLAVTVFFLLLTAMFLVVSERSVGGHLQKMEDNTDSLPLTGKNQGCV